MIANHIIQREVYYTLSKSRALRTEYPAGNYNSGPAYGQKEGGIIKAIAAVAAVVAAIPSGGASLTLLSGLTLASAAVSFVGVITGNKLLTTLGAVGGLASGVMGLASGLGNAASDIGNGLDSAGNAIPNLDGSLHAGIINTADAGQNAVGGYTAGANGGYGTAAQQSPNFSSSLSDNGLNSVPGGMQQPTTGAIAPNYNVTPTEAPGVVVGSDPTQAANIGQSTTSQNVDLGAAAATGDSGSIGSSGIIGDAISGVKNMASNAYNQFNKLSPELQKTIFGGLQQAFPNAETQARTAQALASAGLTDQQAAILKQQMINSNYAGGAGGLVAAPTGIIAGAKTAY